MKPDSRLMAYFHTGAKEQLEANTPPVANKTGGVM